MSEPAFTITNATETHLPGILDIYNQAVRETNSIWSEHETNLRQRSIWMRTRLNNNFPIIVAVSATKKNTSSANQNPPPQVLGYGSYGIFRDFPGYKNTIEHSVYVSPAAHRQGIGRAILSELITHAKANGLRTMVAAIDSQNPASIALHEALGFEQQGHLKNVGEKHGEVLDLVFLCRAL